MGQSGAAPIFYPYRFTAESNTGIPSGFDLNNNGVVSGPDDAGFGFFPGQFGMAVYSSVPDRHDRDPHVPEVPLEGHAERAPSRRPGDARGGRLVLTGRAERVRLSSKSHWDLPILIGGKVVHFLTSHPTPPVFDGPEDRNGTRNYDEIRFWADYISPGKSGYIYDDGGGTGGLKPGSLFVIAGDQNSDPLDGDSIPGSIQLLLEHPLVNTKFARARRRAAERPPGRCEPEPSLRSAL